MPALLVGGAVLLNLIVFVLPFLITCIRAFMERYEETLFLAKKWATILFVNIQM